MFSQMNIPKLRKEKTTKTYHGYELTDDHAFVDQADILTVLKKPENLLPEVRKYIEENNTIKSLIFFEIFFVLALANQDKAIIKIIKIIIPKKSKFIY